MSKEGTATLEEGVLELRWVGVARKLGDGRASPPKDKFDVAETLLDVAFGR